MEAIVKHVYYIVRVGDKFVGKNTHDNPEMFLVDNRNIARRITRKKYLDRTIKRHYTDGIKEVHLRIHNQIFSRP